MLAEDLEEELGADALEKVSIKPIRDSGLTGNFEVKVNGELFHSKKTKGEGFLHQSQKNYEAVVDKCKALLKN